MSLEITCRSKGRSRWKTVTNILASGYEILLNFFLSDFTRIISYRYFSEKWSKLVYIFQCPI